MIVKIVDASEQMLEGMAQFLIEERLIANATIDAQASFFEPNQSGEVRKVNKYVLSGISKSLLFKKINDTLRAAYKEKMPLLYSEPIIMIDPEHTEMLLNRLIKT